jgi:hypothetical protein
MDNKVKEHEYELVSYGKEEKSLGTAWWNGKEIETSKPSLLELLKDTTIISHGNDDKLTIDDGIDFLKALPSYFRSYVSARKVTDDAA